MSWHCTEDFVRYSPYLWARRRLSSRCPFLTIVLPSPCSVRCSILPSRSWSGFRGQAHPSRGTVIEANHKDLVCLSRKSLSLGQLFVSNTDYSLRNPSWKEQLLLSHFPAWVDICEPRYLQCSLDLVFRFWTTLNRCVRIQAFLIYEFPLECMNRQPMHTVRTVSSKVARNNWSLCAVLY